MTFSRLTRRAFYPERGRPPPSALARTLPHPVHVQRAPEAEDVPHNLTGDSLCRRLIKTSIALTLMTPLAAMLLASCARNEAAEAPAAPPPVQAAKVVSKSITEFDEFTGPLRGGRTGRGPSRASRAMSMATQFQQGHEVKKGDILYVIDPRPYQATLKHAQAELTRASARSSRSPPPNARAPPSSSRSAPSRRKNSTPAPRATSRPPRICRRPKPRWNPPRSICRSPKCARRSRASWAARKSPRATSWPPARRCSRRWCRSIRSTSPSTATSRCTSSTSAWRCAASAAARATRRTRCGSASPTSRAIRTKARWCSSTTSSIRTPARSTRAACSRTPTAVSPPACSRA